MYIITDVIQALNQANMEYLDQGSILGPLFFILFMNDFSRAAEILVIILFADDTSVFIVGTEYTKLIELLNVELERVTCWLNANGLAVNVKKTHYNYGVSPSQD